MLSKKETDRYKKLLEQKLEDAGVRSDTVYRVSKITQYPNPAFGQKAKNGMEIPASQFINVPSYQAVNLRKSMIKTVLQGGKQKIEAFLRADLSALKQDADNLTKENQDATSESSESPKQEGTQPEASAQGAEQPQSEAAAAGEQVPVVGGESVQSNGDPA